MTAKEWVVPFIAAAITFGGLWLVAPDEKVADEAQGPDLLFPFDHVVVAEHDEGNTPIRFVLGIWSEPVDLVGGSILHDEFEPTRALLQRTPRVVFLSAGVEPGGAPLAIHRHDEIVLEIEAADPGPRLLVDGYNATRVTAHVFDESGALIFSNAAPEERSRFDGGALASELPAGAWYLGANSTAPEGTQALPPAVSAFVRGLRPMLLGLPEGGVATTQTNALVSLYGTLFITIRVDELVFAP